MNLADLQHFLPHYEEIKVIGQDVEKEECCYHIVGMTRMGKKIQLYVLGMEAPEEELSFSEYCKETIREQRKRAFGEHKNYFMSLRELTAGELKLEVKSASSGRLELGDHTEEVLLLAEFMKAGWKIPEDNRLLSADWKNVSLAEITFGSEADRLPEWSRQEIWLNLYRDNEMHLLEQPVTLTVGEEEELVFSMPDGRSCCCYINRVFPIDIGKEQEEHFKDPRFLEQVTEEELETIKKNLLEALEQTWPKGMCCLGIEYECTEDVALEFYSTKYLDQVPKAQKGTAASLFMMPKAEQPIGKHGLKQRAYVIQTPVAPSVTEMKAELFCYQTVIPEKRERI